MTDQVSTAGEAPETAEMAPSGKVWWVLLAVGSAVIAYGLVGLTRALPPAARVQWAVWLVGGLVVHDFLIVPLYFGVWFAIRRFLPVKASLPIQVGLVLTAVVTLVAFPVLTGYGRGAQPGNTSVLPHDYVANLAGVLAVIWAIVVVVITARTLGPRLRRPT
jgi:hypothetical protein